MFSERRKNFRSPVVGTREAKIIFGKTHLAVRLIDESAGGLKVTSEAMPAFTEGAQVELETDDGDLYRMEVIHIEQRGLCSQIGLRRLQTLTHNGKDVDAGPKREPRKGLRVALFVGLGLLVGMGAQAEPIRRQLVKVPGFSKVFSVPDDKGGPVGPKISAGLRDRLRHSFDIDLFSEPEMSVLLRLRPEQQGKITSVIQAKNSVLKPSVPKSQQAAILYITQMAMLGVLDTEQKYRLESLMEHTIGATDLLQKLVMQYWPTADAEELYRRLGAPALALPQMAEHLKMDERQLRAIRTIIDEALDKSENLYRQGKADEGDSQLLIEAFGYLDDAQQKCLAVLNADQRAIVESLSEKK